MFTEVAKKWFITVFTALTLIGITAAFGAYFDVQKLKARMDAIQPTVHHNNGMLCELAIIMKVPRSTRIKFCVRDEHSLKWEIL